MSFFLGSFRNRYSIAASRSSCDDCGRREKGLRLHLFETKSRWSDTDTLVAPAAVQVVSIWRTRMARINRLQSRSWPLLYFARRGVQALGWEGTGIVEPLWGRGGFAWVTSTEIPRTFVAGMMALKKYEVLLILIKWMQKFTSWPRAPWVKVSVGFIRGRIAYMIQMLHVWTSWTWLNALSSPVSWLFHPFPFWVIKLSLSGYHSISSQQQSIKAKTFLASLVMHIRNPG